MSACADIFLVGMTPTVLRLRALREAAGLTQADLAKRVGVRRATISDLETGKSGRITLELVDLITGVLEVEPGELFERERKPPKRGK
jgi:transcriptional regulator with XRE-family HTH domain